MFWIKLSVGALLATSVYVWPPGFMFVVVPLLIMMFLIPDES